MAPGWGPGAPLTAGVSLVSPASVVSVSVGW